MALRMRKSFSLGKGVRLNVGESGVSHSKKLQSGQRSCHSAAYARREQLRREKEMQKRNELRRDRLAGVTALLPVETVVVHAVDQALNTATGHEEEITLPASNYPGMGFRCHMKFAQTTGFKPVERITDY